MARLARVVIPGLPYHVTQRGNGRARTFFRDEDYACYLSFLTEAARLAEVAVWSWVLMPNHVHLILVPSDADGLRRALALTHRRYAGHIHAREKLTGHFWQGRYGAVVMDEPHLLAAIRYVAQNPVRARLVDRPADWRWSSVHAHLSAVEDGLTAIGPVLDRVADFAGFIDQEAEPGALERLRKAETIGRPLGDGDFVTRLEAITRRTLAPAKRGPKPKKSNGDGPNLI